MADVVRSVMEETGISVTDLIDAAVEIARLEYPTELLSHRDEIIQGLFGDVQCAECTSMGREHVTSTRAHVTEEAQNLPIDQGKAKFSAPPEAMVEDNNDKEQPSEKRPRLKVVIRLNKNKNLPVPAKAIETPKSENCERRTIKSSNCTGHKMDQLQNLSMEAAEGPKSEKDHIPNIVPGSEGSEEFIQRFENAKRKLSDSYQMAACAKRQRNVKLPSTNELPKQGTCMPSQKSVARTPSKISSRSNMGRGKVLPKHRGSRLQMLRRKLGRQYLANDQSKGRSLYHAFVLI